jgi:hypothetical protein
MKRRRLATAIALLLVSSSHPFAPRAAAEPPSQQNDRLAIERTIHDYIDGWYEGNPERMARALHPDLAKRAAMPLPTGRFVIDSTSANAMIEATRAGVGKKTPRSVPGSEIVVFDIVGDLASAKCVSPDYVDLLHVLRINGEWRIVNVLWQPLNPPAPFK